MQVICNCVPPDRSSKMIAQPSTRNANWRAGVAIATEQPCFVPCSLGEKTLSFFTHFLCNCFFLLLFCQSKPRTVELCSRTRSQKKGKERSEEQPVTYCSRNPGACSILCNRRPQTFTVLFTSSALQALLPYHNTRLIEFNTQQWNAIPLPPPYY